MLRLTSGAVSQNLENNIPLNPSDSKLYVTVAGVALYLHAGPREAPSPRLLARRSGRRTLVAGASPTLEPWGGPLRTSDRDRLQMQQDLIRENFIGFLSVGACFQES